MILKELFSLQKNFSDNYGLVHLLHLSHFFYIFALKNLSIFLVSFLLAKEIIIYQDYF